MTDYLLVHGAGQGAWSWGSVWGHLTAPEDHPPALHKKRRANRVHPIDLPGHGADAGGDTAAVRLEDCVQSITTAVERESLKDVVLVGHGLSGSLVLQAARASTGLTPYVTKCIEPDQVIQAIQCMQRLRRLSKGVHTVSTEKRSHCVALGSSLISPCDTKKARALQAAPTEASLPEK